MKKKILLIPLALLLAASLVACPAPTPAPAPAPVTPAPVTPAPVTPTPVTPAPAPVTPPPETPAKPTYYWRISTSASKAKTVVPLFGYRFIDNVDKASNGRIKIGLYLGSVLGDWTACSEMVQEGSLEMGLNCQYPGVDDRLNVQFLNNMFPTEEEARKGLTEPDGWLNEIQRPLWQEIGWHNLASINPGWVGVSMKDAGPYPTTVDGWFDYAGKHRIRCEPSKIMEKAGEALGFKVTVMGFSEVYTSLQTGVIDGWLGSPLESGISYGDIIHSFIDTRNRVDFRLLYMNLELWESLSTEDQDILTNAALEAQTWAWDKYEEDYASQVKEAAEMGLIVYDLAPEIMKEIQRRDKENGWVLAEELVGKELMDKVRTHLSQ